MMCKEKEEDTIKSPYSSRLETPPQKEKKSLQCEFCCETFSTAGTLKQHCLQQHNSKKAIYICEYCEKRFRRKVKLDEHRRAIHTNERPFKCKICLKAYPSNYSLTRHMRIHETSSSDINKPTREGSLQSKSVRKKYICKYCEKCFNKKSNLDYHFSAIHTNERPFKCNVCPQACPTEYALKRHMRLHGKSGNDAYKETREERLQSESCQKTSKETLKQSFLQQHNSRENKHICNYCKKQFTEKNKLNCHYRAIHTNERPFKCEICPKASISQYALKRHMRLHEKSGSDTCKQITLEQHLPEKHCQDKTVLDDHQQTVSTDESPFKCSLCAQALLSSNTLTRFTRKHEKSDTYLCDTCQQIINQESVSKAHLESHEEEEDFLCQMCTDSADKTCVPSYCRLHLDEQRLHCDICKEVITLHDHFKTHFTRGILRIWVTE